MTAITPRSLALGAATALALIAAGCSTNPFAPQGRFFQYHTQDGQVVAEYMAQDAITCQQHLDNMKHRNTYASDAVRCSASSAAASPPISAAVSDPGTRSHYAFRFASMEHCRNMLPAIVAGAANVTANCR